RLAPGGPASPALPHIDLDQLDQHLPAVRGLGGPVAGQRLRQEGVDLRRTPIPGFFEAVEKLAQVGSDARGARHGLLRNIHDRSFARAMWTISPACCLTKSSTRCTVARLRCVSATISAWLAP